MVGTVLAALGVAATLEFGSLQEPPLDAIGMMADAIALSRSCPAMSLDKEIVSMAMARAGIAISPLLGEIAERSQSRSIRYVVLDYRKACNLARERYGKDGTAAAGFLAER